MFCLLKLLRRPQFCPLWKLFRFCPYDRFSGIEKKDQKYDIGNCCDSLDCVHQEIVFQTFPHLFHGNDDPELALSPRSSPEDCQRSHPSCKQEMRIPEAPNLSPTFCLTPRNRSRCLWAPRGHQKSLKMHCDNSPVSENNKWNLHHDKSHDYEVAASGLHSMIDPIYA